MTPREKDILAGRVLKALYTALLLSIIFLFLTGVASCTARLATYLS